MKKYLEVFRMSFKMQIVWRFDVAMTVLATVGRILAAWILWGAVFDGRAEVGGFTLQSMLSYYIVSSLLASLDMSSQIGWEVSGLIRGGRFSGHMVAPMNPQAFFGFKAAGESAFHLFFSVVAAAICVVLFRVELVLAASAATVALAVAMVAVGLLFMVSFYYLLGILTFRFQSINGFLHAAGNLVGFATGALVPLALLPDGVQAGRRRAGCSSSAAGRLCSWW